MIVDDDRLFRTRGSFPPRRVDAPELALADLRLAGTSGLEVVKALKETDGATTVVVLTGYGSIATAVEAMKLGATSDLTKPVDADQILAAFDGTPTRDSSEPTAQPLARVFEGFDVGAFRMGETYSVGRSLCDVQGDATTTLTVSASLIYGSATREPAPASF